MHKFLRQSVCLGIAAFFWSWGATVSWADRPEIMPLSEIATGMNGTGYTVLDATGNIQAFNVDVVGVIDGGKASNRRILANAYGQVIDNAGAILSGMSGSPVYVNGKLIGALSASYQGMSESTFLITPIEDMLKLWSMPDTKNKSHLETIDIKKVAEAKKEAEAKKAKNDADKKSNTNGNAAAKTDNGATQETKAQPEPQVANNPETKGMFIANGFTEKSLAFLSDKLAPMDKITPWPLSSPAGGALGTDYDAYLEPGSPIGAALAYGDFSLVATGTVTAVDGRRVLAFGHSFLHNGNVNYFMTDASVVGTISGNGNGMRFANVGKIIGRISQDRDAGLAGEVGVFPDVVPMRVKVQDVSLNTEQVFDTRIAYDEDLLPQLGAAMAYASLSKVSDDQSESTISIDFAIRTNAVPEGMIKRSNLFYGANDVGKLAVQELTQTLATICGNTDNESDILEVQVNVKVEPGRKTASLISAVPEKVKVKPGDTVNFTTTIKPYRKEKETLTIPFKVPKNQREGMMALDIKGGGLMPVTPAMVMQQAGISVMSEEEKNLSTADKLHKMIKTGRNNEIIIAPSLLVGDKGQSAGRSASTAGTVGEPHKVNLLGKERKNGADEKERENSLLTDYVIDNVIHANLQVEK